MIIGLLITAVERVDLIQRFNAVLLHDCFVDEVAGHSSYFCSILFIDLIFVFPWDHIIPRIKNNNHHSAIRS